MSGKRTKKDVEAAYQRGYRDGFTEAERLLHPLRMFLRAMWRKRALKKYKKAYQQKVKEARGGANGSGATTD